MSVSKSKQHTFVSVRYINNEAQLYKRVKVVGLVFNISSIEHVEKGEKFLLLRKALTHEKYVVTLSHWN